MARYFGTNIISKDISGLTSSQYAAINSGITSNLVNELETNVVHKSGEETITGLKTIQNNRFNIVQTSVTKGTNPSATTYWAIQANDVSNSATWADTRLGAIAWGLQTDGTCSAELTATRNVAGSSDQSIIQAIIKADGTKYGIAPTPTATNSTGDNYIATTGWVNDPTKSTNVVHRWGTETITGEKTFTSEIKGRFRSASYHQGADNTNSWFKLGTFQSTGTYRNQILIFTLWQGAEGHNGTVSGRIFTRTGGNNIAGTFSSAGIEFDYNPTWLNLDYFKILYKEDQGTTNKYVLFELWAKTPSAYTGGVFSILDERTSAEVYNTSWVLYTNPTSVAELPTDYTAISSKLANHNIALNSDVVHIANTETITGEKTFAGGQVTKFKDNTNTIGTYTADAWSTSNLYFSDSTGARIARLQPAYITGTNILKMGMYASNGNTAEQGITVRSDGYTSAPMQAATNSTTSNGIATTGWVNDPAKSTNVVHRSGNETITGTKTWNKADTIIIQNNTAMNTTVAPSTTLYGGIQFNDKNGIRMGKIETFNNTSASDGYVRFGINSTRFFDVNGTSTPYYSALTLYIDNNKVAHCDLPSEVHATNFYGTATRAKWADLAECYKPDQKYSVGTLIKFGGEKDITIANDKCNGVISDKPGFILDAELEDSQPVALVGKTPIRIIGKINKHDKVALSEIPGVGRVAVEGEKVIARALESSDNDDEKLIMCVTKFNLG